MRYEEPLRPQFHFTASTNWLNDPNGCVFHEGEYHLFFQHNPHGNEWGNMSWGHAVSTDLIHWKQLDHALLPYDEGVIFSGTAVVDKYNNSGLGRNGKGPLVAAFTHVQKPAGQAIAYSNDRGRTWALYQGGRHVVPCQGLDDTERDPKLFHHGPSGKWIMLLWVCNGQARFFTSDDLLHWSFASDFKAEGFFECPDLIQMPLDGNPDDTRWILYDAAFRYWIGSFDGKIFRPEGEPQEGELGKNFYAAQTWNNMGDRIVQIGWMRGGEYPGMPFNQQMSFPCELTLRTTARGIRLCRMPVKEIAGLYADSTSIRPKLLAAGESLELGKPGDLLDLDMKFEISGKSSFSISLFGPKITYMKGQLECSGKFVTVPLTWKSLSLRILVDRTSIELFVNGGEYTFSNCYLPSADSGNARIDAGQQPLSILELAVRRLSSVWK